VAARRSQAQAMLTEQTESFITGQYQSITEQYQSITGQYQGGRTGEYPTAAFQPAGQRTGEYRQYQGDAPATAAYPTADGPRAYGGQDSRQAAGQPARAIGGLADSGAAAAGWPAQPGGLQYERQPQQPRPQAQSRQPAPLPAAPLSAPVPAGNGPATGSSPAAQPGGGVPAKGGLNPYDGAITGSYPYMSQAFPAALPGSAQTGSAPAGPAQSGVDDPYYRPLSSNGYPSRGDTGSDPAQAGYGASYGNGYQDPRDRRY
jgi:hypothetical protein